MITKDEILEIDYDRGTANCKSHNGFSITILRYVTDFFLYRVNKEGSEHYKGRYTEQTVDQMIQDFSAWDFVKDYYKQQEAGKVKKGYYWVKLYNHDQKFIMFFNGKNFESFKSDTYLHDEIESYISIPQESGKHTERSEAVVATQSKQKKG